MAPVQPRSSSQDAKPLKLNWCIAQGPPSAMASRPLPAKNFSDQCIVVLGRNDRIRAVFQKISGVAVISKSTCRKA
jgi:hypothetical protein